MLIEVCNLGKDATVNITPNNHPVTNFSCAYKVGFGDKERTQWLDVAWFGEQGQNLAPYLKKGSRIQLTAENLEVVGYQDNQGFQRSSLQCTAVRVVLISTPDNNQQGHQQSHQQG